MVRSKSRAYCSNLAEMLKGGPFGSKQGFQCSEHPGCRRRGLGPRGSSATLATETSGEGSNSLKVESLDHIHIYAADPEDSARFYQHHFDAKQVLRNVNAHGDIRIFLALGGQILVVGAFPAGLVPATPPEVGDGAYSHGFGVAHFGLRVADVRSSTTELLDAGVRVLSQPLREPSGLTYAYVAAPDGVVVELTQYEPAA